jgi:hypothetical protein
MILGNTANTSQTKASTLTTAVQLEFPELAMTDKRALPGEFAKDQFKFPPDTQSSLTTSQRALNWLSYSSAPLVISGATGVGKSVLAWQIMQEAFSRGQVPIMVTAPELILNRDLANEHNDKKGLPYSTINTLDNTLKQLSINQGMGLHYGKSVVLIIDGVTPDDYSPKSFVESFSKLNAIRNLELKVILNIDSDRQLLCGKTIIQYQEFLNPDKNASHVLILARDSQDNKVLTKTDLKSK